jgi:hypothetical protein
MSIDPYRTHEQTLRTCTQHFCGPVLEVGMGGYSTPLLTDLFPQRPYHSIETEPRWAARFSPAHDDHHIHVVREDAICATIDALPIKYWSVVLVDGTTASRAPVTQLLAERADCLVLHDTQESTIYWTDDQLKSFKCSVTSRALSPWTTVVSNRRQLPFIPGAYPTISVVLPTLGRSTLTAVLDYLMPQLGSGDEIIVVVDGPSAAAQMLYRNGVRYVHTPERVGAGVARDLGIKQALGDYLWFVDDDDCPAATALTTIKHAISARSRARASRIHCAVYRRRRLGARA